MTFACYTLGCKLNFAETASIAEKIKQHGLCEAESGEQANWCIINTCTVTQTADKKCRQLIRQAHKEHPQATIIVTGCYAELNRQSIEKMEGVCAVIGANAKADIVKYITEGSKENAPSRHAFMPSCSKGNRTRYFLKVQDGCDYFCTYCTIPQARGRSRNASISQLTQQAKAVAGENGKEIVLTGVNIGDFGRTTGETFLNLLRALDEVQGIARYRISSIEPNLLTEEVIDFVAGSKRIMPHFHIPLQSGSDAVLQLMRRRYDTALFRSRIDYIQRVMPHAFIGVDVIVGMRGETEMLFEETYDFLSSIAFSQLHVFPYSERPGTQALKIMPIVQQDDKKGRSKLLLQLSKQHLSEFYKRHKGQTRKVLWEHQLHSNNSTQMSGFTDNYIKVFAENNVQLHNEVTEVVL